MDIKLQKLEITNFMGIKSLKFFPMGKNAELRGDNATFKTSTASAFNWLLVDKDIHGNATNNFSIKTKKDGVVIHSIDHTVEAELLVDGEPLKLKKNFREVWSKKRKVLKSHKTDYWINDEPDILKKDYDKVVAGLVGPEMLKLLTSVTYFNEIKWEPRRKILFSLCANLNEDNLSAAEKQKKKLANKKKTVGEKIDQIPPRIDELNKTLAATADYNKAEIQAKITSLEGQIQIIKSDSSRAALLKEQGELEAKLSQIRASQAKEKQEATSGVRAEIEKIEDDYAKTQHIFRKIEYEIKAKVEIIEDVNKEIIFLRSNFDEIATDQNTGIEGVCPACGQDIPQAQINIALAKFNQQKSEKLERINRQGKIAKGEKGAAEAAKAKLEDDLKLEKADIVKIERALDKKKLVLGMVKSDETELDTEIGTEIVTIQCKIDKLTNDIQLGDQEADTSSLEYVLKAEMTKIAKIDAGEEHKIRIVKLGEQEKSLCAEIEKLEADLFKAEENIQEQARLLEVPINAKFGLIKFKLFNPLMNGGVEPCCETLVDGIPYGHGLNKGNEINAGLDIIRTLSNHYQIQCPVFIDNCESISYPIDPGCQCFKLIKVKDMNKLEITINE